MKGFYEGKRDSGERVLQTFDSSEQYSIVERRLPHWSQAGAVAFVTWRTWDSLPKPVVIEWLAERDDWLRRQGIDPDCDHWRTRLHKLPFNLVADFKRRLSDRWNDHLDALHGQCVLARSDIARVVAESLGHFNNERYVLTDYVVMPNHVHVLATFADEEGMLRQCESWKRYTARQINHVLGRKGRFWQQDAFDHLVRSPEDFERFRRYIVDNPARARLGPGRFVHYSKLLTCAER